MKYHSMQILASLLALGTSHAQTLAKELTDSEIEEANAKHAARSAAFKKAAAIEHAEFYLTNPNLPPPMSEAEMAEAEQAAVEERRAQFRVASQSGLESAESGEHKTVTLGELIRKKMAEQSAAEVAEITPSAREVLINFLEQEMGTEFASVREAIETALNKAKNAAPQHSQRDLVEEYRSRMREAKAAREAEKMSGEHEPRSQHGTEELRDGSTRPNPDVLPPHTLDNRASRILRINRPRG